MASGRPRQPNDPSVMSSVEAALSSVNRPNIVALIWHWRYELGLVTGLAGILLASGYVLGAAWLIAITVIGLVLFTGAMLWAPSRRRLFARAWCIITPHRVRTACTHSWIQSRDGRLPTVLYTTPAEFGERVTLWCRAGITAGDLEANRDILRTTCWASDVHIITHARYPHIVVLEVIRHAPAERPDETVPAWPHLDHGGQADSPQPEEPALYGGLGQHRPFG